MYKRILVFALGVLLIAGCQQQNKEEAQGWSITLKGKVGFPQSNGKITLTPIVPGEEVQEDTIVLKSNYTFTKQIRLTEPGYYRLNFYDKQVLNLILDRSDMEINVDGNDQYGFAEILGSPDHELINKVQTLQTTLQNSAEVAEMNQQMNQARLKNDEDAINSIIERYQTMEQQVQDQIAELIRQNPNSLASINLLQYNSSLDKEKYFNLYQEVAESLKSTSADFMHAKNFIDFVAKMSLLAIGQEAPEIALPSPDGEVVKLSSLRGQYVLIDFWAKWCRPCRIENPNVVRMYNRFHDKGFEIYGVSLDRTKEDWLQAIEEDKLTWVHVSDLKFWQSEAALRYGVEAIPFTVLLDPDGKIIAKNLRGKALEQKLEEIFANI
ncbi:MAG TPA: TlpA disulfide reductase family protein [Cyclobacteriaceae bacterium]|nr:TlpA disulfide reductase family protein [Cyclobacteriaceae bacterium]